MRRDVRRLAVMQSALPTFCGRCGVSGRRDHCPANRRAVASGKRYGFCCSAVDYAAVHPFATAQRRCTVFLVTMASQNAPGLATIQASGYRVPVSPLIVFTGALALLFSPFGVYSVCIAAITAAICQSPDAHPDADKRWLAAAAAGVFYLLAGLFGGSITALMAALPPVWIQMLAGLALLGTISGSLYQALGQENERDAAVVTFLVTASGVSLAGVGSAFWGLVLGGISYMLLTTLRRT